MSVFDTITASTSVEANAYEVPLGKMLPNTLRLLRVGLTNLMMKNIGCLRAFQYHSIRNLAKRQLGLATKVLRT